VVAPRRSGRTRFTLLVVVLTAVTLLTLDVRGVGPIDSARRITLSALSPVADAVAWVLSPVGNAWNGITRFDEVERENAELHARLDELAGDDARETSARETLQRFLEQADVTFAGDVPQVVGRVVSGPVSAFELSVTIDKGADDGIREGMPVVTGAGLVGRVQLVTDRRSVIQLIVDPRFSVGARHVPTQGLGLIEGRGSGRPLSFVVPGDVEVGVGDLLETSGLDRSLYPPDVPIGRIIALDPEAGPEAGTAEDGDGTDPSTTTTTAIPGASGSLPSLEPVETQSVAVELHARLDRLTFLTVLLWEPAR